MRRKRKTNEDRDNTDRWVVSYADFITLLFALFTTLYAISNVDQVKLKRFTGSMKTAFKVDSIEAVDTAVIEGITVPNYADIDLESELRAGFKKFTTMEGIVISRDERGVVLSLGDTLLFESGTAEIRAEARPLFAAVAPLIKQTQRTVIVEGHTDSIPLRNSRFASNMELSAARAAAVFAFFVTEDLVNPDQLSTAGYGEFRPVASNAAPEGRARNRRIDIIFVSPRGRV
ncbi:MAG: OmpA family protein [Nitrospirae bacterium]|nr:OmpA family protein [Nitrospirota bacterium]NTW65157.1 OmpA family protein [Nitrospirota bacterium]